MRPSEVADFIARAMDSPKEHPPIFLSGPPGVGKSSVVRQVAAKVGANFIDLRAVLLDPTDIRGLPFPKDGKTIWYPPSFFPPTESTEKWIIHLDELNLATMATQHSCYQLVLDRAAGEYYLPEAAFIIASGNRVEDRAGVREVPAPLLNRFCYIPFELNVQDWTAWAINHEVSPEIIAFINLNTDMLFKFDGTRDIGPFPTPRSVVAVDRLLKLHGGSNYVWGTVEGAVGKEWMAKFKSYLDIYRELPNIDDILTGKVTTVPVRSDLRYAVSALLGTKAKVEHISHVLKYANKLPTEQGVFLVQLMTRRPELLRPVAMAPEWREWLRNHSEFAAI